MALAKAVNLIKANSSRWIREHKRKFAWQDGYGAFRVSESNTQAVVDYIRDQEKASSQTHLRAGISGISETTPL